MITTEFRADLLLELAEMLDRADEEHLKRGEPTYRQRYLLHPCGTPACALGHWAAAHPERGWRLQGLGPEAGLYQDGKFAAAAAATEFGLTDVEVEELFGFRGCGNAKSAREAARYIRKFVRRKRGTP